MINNQSRFKLRVKSYLLSRKGRANAITRRELLYKLNYPNDRKLRLMIAELRRGGIPILSVSTKPAGYYVPATYQELQEGLAFIRSYVIDLCVQRAAMKKYGEQYLAPAEQGVLL